MIAPIITLLLLSLLLRASDGGGRSAADAKNARNIRLLRGYYGAYAGHNMEHVQDVDGYTANAIFAHNNAHNEDQRHMRQQRRRLDEASAYVHYPAYENTVTQHTHRNLENLPLVYVGETSNLGECQGDCDDDDDCQGDLVCYQRGDTESVPGCSGTGEDGKDYCCDRTEKYLFRIGNDLGSDSYALCEGDCDNDGDCKGGLLCFQRSEFTKVPGCDGEGRRNSDYCVVSLTEEPTTSPTPQTPNPTKQPTSSPVTDSGTNTPTTPPSKAPTNPPTEPPTAPPSDVPTRSPSEAPTNVSSSSVVTPNPTASPTGSPIDPTNNPTASPPSSSQQPTDQCNICGSGDASPHPQSDYCGNIATTVNGRTCQRWDSQFPHEHPFSGEFGSEDNYCRNPDGEPRTWCYTTDPDERWELCAVQFCEDITTTTSTASATTTTAGTTSNPTKEPTASPIAEITCGVPIESSTVGLNTISMPDCGTSDGDGGAIWYKLVGAEGEVVLSTCTGTDYDSKIRVYTDEDDCVAGNDDTCDLLSEVSFTAEEDTYYKVLVHGYDGSEGEFTLSSTCTQGGPPTPTPPPSEAPTTPHPTGLPTRSPINPTNSPTANPSKAPTANPINPTNSPTADPSRAPTPPPTLPSTPMQTPPPTPPPTQPPTPPPPTTSSSESLVTVPCQGPTPASSCGVTTCKQNERWGENDPSKYNIDLTLEVVSQLSIDAYTRAHEKFTSVIVGDLPSVPSDQISDNDPCANSLPDVIDDVHICGREVPIDGTLNIIGQATWLYAGEINGKWTAVTGFMNFDCADTQFLSDRNLLDTLILHEMGHVMGIGSMWSSGYNNLKNITNGEQYTGEKGIDVWKNGWGCDTAYPPIELDGNAGTRGVHWDEACFGYELMSGYLNVGIPGPFSILSIATLEDGGYTVDYNAADEYSPNTNCCFPSRRKVSSSNAKMPPNAGKPSNRGKPPKRGKPPNRGKPPLSEKGRARAVAYGQTELSKRKRPPGLAEKDKKNGLVYNDKSTLIMMEEGGYIHGVYVESEDD